MMYSKKALFYFHRLDHAGIDRDRLHLGGLGEAGMMANGDKVQMWLYIDNDQIHQVRYHVFGSVATMACAEFMAEMLEGSALEVIDDWTGERILDELQLPAVKMNSAIIVTTAVERALQKI